NDITQIEEALLNNFTICTLGSFNRQRDAEFHHRHNRSNSLRIFNEIWDYLDRNDRLFNLYEEYKDIVNSNAHLSAVPQLIQRISTELNDFESLMYIVDGKNWTT